MLFWLKKIEWTVQMWRFWWLFACITPTCEYSCFSDKYQLKLLSIPFMKTGWYREFRLRVIRSDICQSVSHSYLIIAITRVECGLLVLWVTPVCILCAVWWQTVCVSQYVFNVQEHKQLQKSFTAFARRQLNSNSRTPMKWWTSEFD